MPGDRFAVVEDGIVTNIVVATEEFAVSKGWVKLQGLVEVEIGWIYGSSGGGTFSPPVIELDVLKAAKWDAVKTLRDRHIDGGVDVAGIGRFDSDPLSRSNINGAVTGAMLAAQGNQPFEISWKLADNSVETLSGAQMIAAGVAVLRHVAACHANSQVLGLAIQGAADKAALDAIDIETGWP